MHLVLENGFSTSISQSCVQETHTIYMVLQVLVVEFEDVLYMFYIGFKEWTVSSQAGFCRQDTPINLATSTDGGVTWTKDPNNPIPINNLTEPGQV